MINYEPLFKTMKERKITSYRLGKMGFPLSNYYAMKRGENISTHTLNQSIDILKRFIVAGRGSVRDCGEERKNVILQLCIFNAVVAAFYKSGQTIPIVIHSCCPGVLGFFYQ